MSARVTCIIFQHLNLKFSSLPRTTRLQYFGLFRFPLYLSPALFPRSFRRDFSCPFVHRVILDVTSTPHLSLFGPPSPSCFCMLPIMYIFGENTSGFRLVKQRSVESAGGCFSSCLPISCGLRGLNANPSRTCTSTYNCLNPIRILISVPSPWLPKTSHEHLIPCVAESSPHRPS